VPDLGFPLLTPFLAARDLGKKNPDLKGNEKGEDPRAELDKKAKR